MQREELAEVARVLRGYAEVEPCQEARACLLELVQEIEQAYAAPSTARQKATVRWSPKPGTGHR